MKKIFLTFLAAAICWQANAAQTVWLTDLPKALEQAKAEDKAVLVDFTGSDWCGWCIKFKKEVLATSEFEAYAAKNLVLVELDFPKKRKLPAKLKEANDALKAKYDVKGFPTLLLLDKDGKEIGRQRGFSKGGPVAFIAKLEKFKNR